LIETKSKPAVIEYFKEKNIFHRFRYCPACALDGAQVRMKSDKRKDSIDNDAWRCSTCTKRIALRRETFFETSKIAITTILQLIMYWATQMRQVDQERLLQLNIKTIRSLQQQFRAVINRALDKASTRLGGPGRVVEIDESLFIKVKHHRG
jgi:hypothetical protein